MEVKPVMTLAMTGPVLVETLLAQWLAKPYIAGLGPAVEEKPAGLRTQLLFTVPLSFGGVLLAVAGFTGAKSALMVPLRSMA